jgi:hypothetical protein
VTQSIIVSQIPRSYFVRLLLFTQILTSENNPSTSQLCAMVGVGVVLLIKSCIPFNGKDASLSRLSYMDPSTTFLYSTARGDHTLKVLMNPTDSGEFARAKISPIASSFSSSLCQQYLTNKAVNLDQYNSRLNNRGSGNSSYS